MIKQDNKEDMILDSMSPTVMEPAKAEGTVALKVVDANANSKEEHPTSPTASNSQSSHMDLVEEANTDACDNASVISGKSLDSGALSIRSAGGGRRSYSNNNSNRSLTSSFRGLKKACAAPKRPMSLHRHLQAPNNNNNNNNSRSQLSVSSHQSGPSKDHQKDKDTLHTHHNTDDNKTVSSSSSPHGFRPHDSITEENLMDLSNLDISLVQQDNNQNFNNNDNHNDDLTVDSDVNSHRSSLPPLRRFSKNGPPKQSPPNESIPEDKAVVTTAPGLFGFVSQFLRDRQETFADNIATLAELVTQQREWVGDQDDDDETNNDNEINQSRFSREEQRQRAAHQLSQQEIALATYLRNDNDPHHDTDNNNAGSQQQRRRREN